MNLRPVLKTIALLMVGVFLSADSPNANAQGILQRMRSRWQAPAPQPQYRPSYRPQVTPNTSRALPNGTQYQGQAPNQGQSPIVRIDPRTGRAIIVQTSPAGPGGRPIQVRPSEPSNQAAADSKNPKSPTDATRQVSKPSLGLRVVQAKTGTPGLEVMSFQERSLADEAGVRVGDRILMFNGRATPDVDSLAKQVATYREGQVVTLRIGRGNRVGDVRVPLVRSQAAIAAAKPKPSATDPKGGRPSPAQLDNLDRLGGVRLGVEIEDRDGVRGVIVTSVDPGSPASTAGLQPGDRIVSVDGRMVADSGALARELSGRSKDTPMAMQLVRQNQLRASTVSFSKPSSTPDEVAKNAASKSQPSASTKQPSENKSVLGGVGSMLGGLFGSSQNPSTDAKQDSSRAETAEKSKSSGVELNGSSVAPTKPTSANAANQASAKKPPLATGNSILMPGETAEKATTRAPRPSKSPDTVVQAKPSTPVGPVATADMIEDDMAFGDDEPIDQVIFSRNLDPTPARVDAAKAPKSDPPSAAKITPPAKSKEPNLAPPTNDPSPAASRIKALEAEVQRLKNLLKN